LSAARGGAIIATMPPAERHRYEMTISRADFLRLLPAAVGHGRFRVEGDEIRSEGGEPAWRIVLGERPARPFGSVALPVLAVDLAVEAADAGGARAFVERFLLGFQRAGG
jgi:hypothetical protein